jgi:lipopolysaccharide export system protein LptA
MLTALSAIAAPAVRAQGIDLTQGGPIQITARDGIEWRQAEQVVIAKGDAKAVRGNVTVTADRLLAWYRKKGTTETSQPVTTGLTGATETEGNEVYRMRAEGHVHIYTQTDQGWGDQATYDLDQVVLVMTGNGLKLTTPNDTLTARDTLEYWSDKHMAVARGDAVVVTNDARRISADTLVAYTEPTATAANSGAGQSAPGSTQPGSAAPAPPAAAAGAGQPERTSSGATGSGSGSQKAAQPANPTGDPMMAMAGRLERVEAFGNVTVRTVTDIVIGDRGVYVPDTGIAHLGGHVRITRGLNQINGAEAVVNMKTGVATLLSGGNSRVSGLVVPNDQSNPPPGDVKGKQPPGTQPKADQPKRGASQ